MRLSRFGVLRRAAIGRHLMRLLRFGGKKTAVVNGARSDYLFRAKRSKPGNSLCAKNKDKERRGLQCRTAGGYHIMMCNDDGELLVRPPVVLKSQGRRKLAPWGEARWLGGDHTEVTFKENLRGIHATPRP